MIATEPETIDLDVGLAGDLVSSGTAVLLVTPQTVEIAGALNVHVGGLDRTLAPAVSIVPTQLLAWSLASRRGRAPGAYHRASKVTTRE